MAGIWHLAPRGPTLVASAPGLWLASSAIDRKDEVEVQRQRLREQKAAQEASFLDRVGLEIE